ncbi:cyclic 3',5'-adenosine monophosphate phosphodiesterase [Polystyrenella longa]|uniref:Cyclic 3',5'-adenosine monophosphate phosphodiesterase n=1 Tax=Polystyrenella longa TaxID=2528007 RepID=A0A518CLH2_9PLAN|nr:metallophosphoesterase [Polystyrenella longa]QDU80014.1 cyclic 3',5'-adenosine monophosphate phosphodiesterase [Polystyrenella longa]
MTRLIQFSDLHFGPPYVEKVGNLLPDLAHELDSDAIIISGDFTQNCREEEFQAAHDFLKQLPDVPTLTIPGNHDVPKYYDILGRLNNPYDFYRKYINEDLDVSFQLPGVRIVGLNSTKPLRTIKNGRISREQLDFAAKELDDAEESDWRIVVAHHHFAPAPDYEGSDVMPKAKRALDRFNRLQVDLILGGHLHRAYIGNSLDVYAGNEILERGMIIVQCGTSTSRRGRAREREKNSFNVIDLNEHTVQITHWLYFDKSARFCQVSQYRFPKPALRTLDCQPEISDWNSTEISSR